MFLAGLHFVAGPGQPHICNTRVCHSLIPRKDRVFFVFKKSLEYNANRGLIQKVSNDRVQLVRRDVSNLLTTSKMVKKEETRSLQL